MRVEVDDVEVVFQHGLKRLYFFWPLGVIQAAMDLGDRKSVV